MTGTEILPDKLNHLAAVGTLMIFSLVPLDWTHAAAEPTIETDADDYSPPKQSLKSSKDKKAEPPPMTQLATMTISAPGETASPASNYIGTDPHDPETAYRVGQAGIDLFGKSGNSNSWMVVNRLPSVYAPGIDPYGLVNIPGGNKGIMIRGEPGTHGGSVTIDGLPLTGVGPGPGTQWLFDMENMHSVSVLQGPIAPDRFSFFTTNGIVNSQILWPMQQRRLHAAQSYGSFNFKRTFLRADSGQLSDGSAFFLSGSYTSANKWRGAGQSPAGRTNLELAWTRPFGDNGNAKLLFAYDDANADNYRPLTYSQTTDLSAYRYFDYSATASANPSLAVDYYGYNRQHFQNWTLLGEFEYFLDDDNKLSFKPYYLSEQGTYWNGMDSGEVRQWLIDHDWYGMTLEWQTRFAGTDFKLGYWTETANPPAPPTVWKMYQPTAAGGLTNGTWNILSQPSSRHLFNSVYVKADRSFNALQMQLGARFIRETLPGINFYDTSGLGDVSYTQALAQSAGIVANRSVSGFSINEFLPFVAFNYTLNPAANIKLSLGRNYGAPAVSVWPLFQENSAALLARGLTANTLWHNLKAETSDAVDLGLNLHSARGYFAPTVYYARYHNKEVAYDPGLGVTYAQNIGETRAYGAQIATGWSPLESIDLFATASYNRNEFVKNLPLLNGGSLQVKGNQMTAVPEWLASAGATWHRYGFSISPMVRYTGARYGDVQNLQKIDGYFLADLKLGYSKASRLGKLGLSLAVQNVFDKKYVGFINNFFIQRLTTNNAYYYPGAPRSIVAQVSLDLN